MDLGPAHMKRPGHQKDTQANKFVRKWQICAANRANVSESGGMTFTTDALLVQPLLDASPAGEPLDWFGAVFL